MKEKEFLNYLIYDYKSGTRVSKSLKPNTARSILHRVKRVELVLNNSLDDIMDGTMDTYINVLNQYQKELKDISNHPATYISALGHYNKFLGTMK